MPQSLAKILVHAVFSTKERRPFLRDRPLRNELYHYIGGILAKHDCEPIITGGVEDHVHALLRPVHPVIPSTLFFVVMSGAASHYHASTEME